MPNPTAMSGDQLLLSLLIALFGWSALMFGHWVRLRGFKARDRSQARNHSFEKLRWATELATASDPQTATIGMTALRAISEASARGTDDRDIAAALVVSIGEREMQTLPRTAA